MNNNTFKLRNIHWIKVKVHCPSVLNLKQPNINTRIGFNKLIIKKFI